MILNYVDKGSGPIIVLLHGMASSHKYWDEHIKQLSLSHRVIAVDLVGYGASPKPKNVIYNDITHVEAIKQTLDFLKITEPVKMAAHSMGCLVALRVATYYPEYIESLALFGLPFYGSATEARNQITKGSKLRRMAYYGPASKILCTVWCGWCRPFSKYVAPWYLKEIPPGVAADSVMHTWQSYSQSMEYLIESPDTEMILRRVKQPVCLIYGENENEVILRNISSIRLPQNIKLHFMTGGHHAPIKDIEKSITYIIDAI